MGAKKVLMIGGSRASIRSALDMAKNGNHVYLVEMQPWIGKAGLAADISSNDKGVFDLSLWEEVKKQENIEVISNAILEDVQKSVSGFKIRIKKTAPRVIEEKCNDCKACIKVCPVSLWDDYNESLSLRTAIDFFNVLIISFCSIILPTDAFDLFIKTLPFVKVSLPINSVGLSISLQNRNNGISKYSNFFI